MRYGQLSKKITAAFLAAATFAGTAVAEGEPADKSTIRLELNGASNTDAGGCRLSFVARNSTGTGLQAAGWQVGIFDTAGIVSSILMLDFGAMPEGKTKIVLFELPGRSCDNISRVLVNDISQCQPDSGTDETQASICLDALETESRTDIEFGI